MNKFIDMGAGLSTWAQSAATGDTYAVTVNYPVATATSAQIQYPSSIQPPTVTSNWFESLNQSYQMMLYGMMINANVRPQSVIYNGVMDIAETAEEKAERLAKQAERAAKRKAAEQRAEHLLFTILTPSQVKQYRDDDYFEMDVDSRIYRIRKGRSMNVELIEAGKPRIRYCAHPSDAHDTPVPDVMLSQMLMLKANEAEFLKIANRTVVQCVKN